jgi:hypothetical protein
LSGEILGDGEFFILSSGNVEGFDHQHGGTIDVEVSLELLPQLAVELIGQ